ncbi:universal stress protein [Nocardia puris]|uniref:Nucleotide-binding universal stress UspA family protein n=1 Tax=Nocardia puris TaxID=208602 RepID=A0A366DHJ8_9NOCA|nr:universal stress protein [Nocardia puris]MBF6213243.1 universal stress protein [Nocardia puris]MBF6369835.1 universal stress protein [Nocardia puris]MBF6462122.1 universal stress protein [Nocardia puris]RBO89425.1 nucleotide-binding universal stress UspA family protein [Nocardia puris]
MNASLVLSVAAVWILTGLVTGLWMVRRGHDPMWIPFAVLFGPLFVPIALERVERHPRLATSGPGGGPAARSRTPDGPRVLVGLNGSAESERVLAAALRLFGSRCGVLVLAEVVGYDATSDDSQSAVDAAARRLAAAAAVAGGVGETVRFEVLAGPAGEALRRFAAEQDMDVLVVGRRRPGLSTRLLGSVSADVVRHSPVPVLVVEPGNNPAPARRTASAQGASR